MGPEGEDMPTCGLTSCLRIYGQRHTYKPTRGPGRNLFFTLCSGEYTILDMAGKAVSVPPPTPLEELDLVSSDAEVGDEKNPGI